MQSRKLLKLALTALIAINLLSCLSEPIPDNSACFMVKNKCTPESKLKDCTCIFQHIIDKKRLLYDIGEEISFSDWLDQYPDDTPVLVSSGERSSVLSWGRRQYGVK